MPGFVETLKQKWQDTVGRLTSNQSQPGAQPPGAAQPAPSPAGAHHGARPGMPGPAVNAPSSGAYPQQRGSLNPPQAPQAMATQPGQPYQSLQRNGRYQQMFRRPAAAQATAATFKPYPTVSPDMVRQSTAAIRSQQEGAQALGGYWNDRNFLDPFNH